MKTRLFFSLGVVFYICISNLLTHIVAKQLGKRTIFDWSPEALGHNGSKLKISDNQDTKTNRNLEEIYRGINSRKYSGIRASLFPNVPPYYKFVKYNESVEVWPDEVKEHLRWQFSNRKNFITTKTVQSSGFTVVEDNPNYIWEQFMRGKEFYHRIKPHVKINQTPGTKQIDSKALLWLNLRASIFKHGRRAYNFIPKTFMLPNDLKALQAAMRSKSCGTVKCMWVSKPPNKADGKGIEVITSKKQLPVGNSVTIVQEYIKPLIVNDRKFDLRLYVFVTNFRPLRAYFYKDGYVRFAATKYTNDTRNASSLTMHLTNRAVNKKSKDFVKNDDPSGASGNQWSVQTLWRHLESRGIQTEPIIGQIEDLIIKTLASAEGSVAKFSSLVPNRYTSYQLYGFDVGLDENLKPWLFEVNFSPGMGVGSGFLLALKSKLVTEYLNIAGYHFPPNLTEPGITILQQRLDLKLPTNLTTFNPKLYSRSKSMDARKKQKEFSGEFSRSYLPDILKKLTPDDLRELITAEDELTQCDGFQRIFPSPKSHHYLKYFSEPRYYNFLLSAWEVKYGKDRVAGINRLKGACEAELHLLK